MRTGTHPDHVRGRPSQGNATCNSDTKADSGKRFMTRTLTADPYLWRWGGAHTAAIRPWRTPRPGINRKLQNLRHKSHSRASATRNGRANAGI